jgi:primosomal protein N'
LMHHDEKKLSEAANNLADFIRNSCGDIRECGILGPSIPMIQKVQRHYRRNILIKTADHKLASDVSRRIYPKIAELRRADFRVAIDVDPRSIA